MDALEVILTRKSVRQFDEREIEEEKINTLLKAAMASPSGVNKQPWKFVVVKTKENKQKVIDNMPFGKYNSPIIIIPCVKDLETVPLNHDLAYCDLSSATENILLAAEAMGLGAVWTACWPYEDRYSVVKEVLGIPENVMPLAIIPVGHPAETPAPKDKWRPEKIHRGRW